ncbi:MAG: YebC/PmpR family DNA-binding transcriptional regulator [Armatimonadota bacterium]|nr:YebC/PmpR family DNA-binding transcriptional regulator [Armatimonadota bacterium]MDR5703626.1 YebC/PmpR family DNA-binding transcriptional regulator [Armatimonadota bacterium]MDR7435680.1 YebC/PmpR family DNA-binding transcriptional regulator [Armatimonadota bacterium]
MSGHSKWHNIRIKKQKMDQIRGKLFSKLSREISVAAREGGGDPEMNPRLRTAIERAREAGMPNENIQRAIQRGVGGGGAEMYEQVIYEGYAPGGVAVLIEALTDNRNRTAAEVRSLFTKNGGSLAEAGAVAWLFDKKGLITVEREAIPEDELLLLILEAGAEDMRVADDSYEIVTPPEAFETVKGVLQAKGVPMTSAELTMIPKSTTHVEGPEAVRVLKLLEALEDHDDIQRVYSNFDIPEEILQKVS